MHGPRGVIAILLVAGVHGCTNYMVTRGASPDNSTQIAYNSDGQSLYGYMKHYPAAEHPAAGTQRQIWEFVSGKYLGSIPEAKTTYNVVGNTNEFGLTIAETTFDGLENLMTPAEGSKIDYYSLMWITLQRCRTAREAITTMDHLTQTYGYASTGESFSIADTSEVWIMEMIGKGPKQLGTVWVARQVPEGFVSGHANQARIRTWPREKDSNMWSKDVVQFARAQGLYSSHSTDDAFSFSDTFDPVTPAGARLCELRVWNFFRTVLPLPDRHKFASDFLDYVQGRNLTNRMPLWVQAGSDRVPVNQTMWATRSHYRDTWFDQRSDIGAAPFHSELRMRPNEWKVDNKTYVNERNVGYQGTFFNFVAQGRGGMPYPLGGLVWFGIDDASHSYRTPMYSASQTIPMSYAETNGNATKFVLKSAFWIFNLVANMAYARYDLISPEVQSRVVEVETEHFRLVSEQDNTLLTVLATSGKKAALKQLTEFSVQTADSSIDQWVEFWQLLVVRHRDGLVVTPGDAPAARRDQPQPANAVAVGYDQAWYGRIAQETGDRYLLPDAPEELVHHQRRKLKLVFN